MKYNIIGMGNIGLRYLQSILNTDENYEVMCYDISKNFEDRTISFLSKNNLPNKKVLFSTSLELLEENTDNETVVILATTAEKREELILQFAKKAPKLIVSEKLVCTSRKSYLNLVKELNKINYNDILVNFFPRNQIFFKGLTSELPNNAEFKMSVEIPRLGLACNGIHFIDIFLWLSGSYKYKYKKESFHLETYEQKRPGFYDFAGLIEIESEVNSSSLILRDDNSGLEQYIDISFKNGGDNTIKKYRYFMFDELLVTKDDSTMPEKNNELRNVFQLIHVSQYICGEIIAYVENGKCRLPNIFDAYHSHSVLFDFIEEYNLGKFKIT
tara:strand:- start:20108 stop:21091 length:984 start_codon:yes stop_codon:yes gene_type:complete